MSTDIRSGLIAMITDKLDLDENKIYSGAQFVKDLGADELDLVELYMAVEEKWGVEIPDEDFHLVATVGDLTDYISRGGSK